MGSAAEITRAYRRLVRDLHPDSRRAEDSADPANHPGGIPIPVRHIESGASSVDNIALPVGSVLRDPPGPSVGRSRTRFVARRSRPISSASSRRCSGAGSDLVWARVTVVRPPCHAAEPTGSSDRLTSRYRRSASRMTSEGVVLPAAARSSRASRSSGSRRTVKASVGAHPHGVTDELVLLRPGGDGDHWKTFPARSICRPQAPRTRSAATTPDSSFRSRREPRSSRFSHRSGTARR
jgi:hypothetical protein